MPRRRRLRVTLSAAFCPATGFSAPYGITRWEELRAVAAATAAGALGISPDLLTCEMDNQGLCIAATVSLRLVSDLKRWAAQERLHLESVRPLWSTASQCPLVREDRVKALAIHEPDAISLIAITNNMQAVAMTMPMRIGAELEPGAVQAHSRRWLMSHGLSQDQLVTLRFGKATAESETLFEFQSRCLIPLRCSPPSPLAA